MNPSDDDLGAAPPVRAAGCVLWRAGASGPEIALVHRPRYDDWSFPKGKLDGDETLPRCAVRETAEETGHTARLGAWLGRVSYTTPTGDKQVDYWAAQERGGTFVANAETDELRFVEVDKAAQLLTHAHDVDVLRRFVDLGVPTATVLLVRHAKAGSRDRWNGDDDLRPLSGTGHEQAQKLVDLLDCFGPDRLLTAPPVRCRDTIAPFAEHVGLPIGEEPLLGEHLYRADPDAGLDRLRGIAARPEVTLVSSQGGVIPEVVAVLARAARQPVVGVDPDDVPSRKASTWVLTFAGGTLRAADYYRAPGA